MMLPKEINLSKKIELLLKGIISLSFSILGLLLMQFYVPKIALYNILLTLLIAIFVFQTTDIKKINRRKFLISLLISAYVNRLYMLIATDRIVEIMKSINILNNKIITPLIPPLIAIFSYPAIVFCIYYWIEKHHPRVIKELKTLNKVEKKYLQIVGIISFILVSIISIYTSAFHIVTFKEKPIVDVIYTSDNGLILGQDAWFNIGHPENDIRQPLFGIFSLPFSIPAHILSELFFFIPKNISYGIILSIIQFLLLAMTTIMLSRLLKLEDYEKKYFYIFFSLSFPYLLFGVLIEQYVIALFYLILTIYQYEKLKNETNHSYLGAVSTLVTSGIIFPLITKSKNIKDTFQKYRETLISFLIITVLGGQFIQTMTIQLKMTFFMTDFAEKASFVVKWNQYTAFIKNIFIISTGHIEKLLGYHVYRLPIPETMSIIGILLLGLSIVSFIINRKEKIAWISILWIIFSFIILCMIGWGTKENGLILYSLYFAWPFYCLFYLLIKKIIKNKKIFSISMIIIIGIMFIFTSKELFQIIKFALNYYHR